MRNPDCTKCALGQDRLATRCMWGNRLGERGEIIKDSPIVMLIKSHPNPLEDMTGEHLRSEPLWAELFNGLDIPEANIYVTYLSKCNTSDKARIPRKQRDLCLPYLLEEIRAVNPAVIITVGEDVLEYFTRKKNLKSTAGTGVWIPSIKKFVVPTFDIKFIKDRPWELDRQYTAIDVAWQFANRKKAAVSWVENDLNALLADLFEADFVSFDIETDSITNEQAVLGYALDPLKGRPWFLALSLFKYGVMGAPATLLSSYLFDRQAYEDGLWDQIGPQLKPYNLVAQNGKFDLAWLMHHCIGWDDIKLYADTAIQHHILNENSAHHLNMLQWRYLPEYAGEKNIALTDDEDDLETEIFAKYAISLLPQDVMKRYCVIDTISTGLLHDIFQRKMDAPFQALSKMQARASSVLARTEYRGCPIDLDKLHSLLGDEGQATYDNETYVVELAEEKGIHDFNPASPLQVANILYERYKLEPYRGDDGKITTDDDALLVLSQRDNLPDGAAAFLTYLRSYRKHNHARQTLQSIKEKHVLNPHPVIRTSYQMYFVVTGRLSSREPNLQNVPKGKHSRIKEVFVPREGFKFVEADYSQAEYRIIAHMSEDPLMIEMLHAGHDFHDATVMRLAEMGVIIVRDEAKTVNFALLYGAGDLKVGAMIKRPPSDVRMIKQAMAEAFPVLHEYVKAMPYRAQANNNSIRGPFGRVRRVPYLSAPGWSGKWWRSRGARQIINSPVQGGASDLTMAALEALDCVGNPVVLTVHDSIVWEVRESVAEQFALDVKEKMESIKPYDGSDKFLVPMKADVIVKKHNWKE